RHLHHLPAVPPATGQRQHAGRQNPCYSAQKSLPYHGKFLCPGLRQLSAKSEIRIPKSETNPKPEIPNPKANEFLSFGHSDLFRIPTFGFRISWLRRFVSEGAADVSPFHPTVVLNALPVRAHRAAEIDAAMAFQPTEQIELE